jgi:hypothetical protein
MTRSKGPTNPTFLEMKRYGRNDNLGPTLLRPEISGNTRRSRVRTMVKQGVSRVRNQSSLSKIPSRMILFQGNQRIAKQVKEA